VNLNEVKGKSPVNPTILNVLSRVAPDTVSVTRNVTDVVPTAPIVPVIAPVLPIRERSDGKLFAGIEYVTPLPPRSSVAANSVLFADTVVLKVKVAPAAGEVHERPEKVIVAILVPERPAPFVTTTLKGLFAACPDANVPILNLSEPEFVNTKSVTS
jgi:hypothetical protein